MHETGLETVTYMAYKSQLSYDDYATQHIPPSAVDYAHRAAEVLRGDANPMVLG